MVEVILLAASVPRRHPRERPSGQAALATLSESEADEFAACVRSEDIARLSRLPGIGTKTTQRPVIEMRDRLRNGTWRSSTRPPTPAGPPGAAIPATA